MNFIVEVLNLSPKATEAILSDFFSFCGRVQAVKITKEENEASARALVTFTDKSSIDTALLLNQAFIIDRPISISIYKPKEENPVDMIILNEVPPNEKSIQVKEAWNAEDKPKASIIASLLASGYILATDTMTRAKEFDEKRTNIRTRAHSMNEKYKLSEKASNLSDKASHLSDKAKEKGKEFDSKYHISDKLHTAGDSISSTAKKALENERVAKGYQYLVGAKDRALEKASSIKGESKQIIDQKMQEREQQKS